jgi:H+/Cl- antiporter ClcA
VRLVLCKGLAYCAALAGFRGGPTFPAMFLGAAGGIALSHLPGLGVLAGAAIGLGAMTAAMLRLPLSAVLLTALFLGSSGFSLMPLTIVAVVVYLTANWLSTPSPAPAAGASADVRAEHVAAAPAVPPPRGGAEDGDEAAGGSGPDRPGRTPPHPIGR